VLRPRHLAASGALLAGALATTALVAGPVTAAEGSGRPFTTALTGAAEVPRPGDPDGTGTARLRVNPGTGSICVVLSVADIAPATAAHVHEAPAGVAGPVVLPLAAPSDGSSSTCVVNRALAQEINKDPAGYYVNVHNSEFPGGALRGQLR
jgi:hypothetical protein